uniref:Uncharacterized protein n=1 Tax=Arundo donax TaxID=35708 RepID=A0A0A9G8Q1_ARUDO
MTCLMSLLKACLFQVPSQTSLFTKMTRLRSLWWSNKSSEITLAIRVS